MKRIAVALAFLFAIGFSSCQCSEKPPVPPVEDDQAAVEAPLPIGGGTVSSGTPA
jgi:hypothetical protein